MINKYRNLLSKFGDGYSFIVKITFHGVEIKTASKILVIVFIEEFKIRLVNSLFKKFIAHFQMSGDINRNVKNWMSNLLQ